MKHGESPSQIIPDNMQYIGDEKGGRSRDKPGRQALAKGSIGCCGFDCRQCTVFWATKTDDQDLRQGEAKRLSRRFGEPVDPSRVNCLGCQAAEKNLFYRCVDCRLRKCARSRGLRQCQGCPDYICTKLGRH